METMWRVLTRKKILDPISEEQSELGRILNTFDLTALGVGSTLGVGIYVMAGQVAKDIAGPAVVLSFLIATIASVFAGLCYAEFGARAPRAGSAYIYSYVCVGEFIAFVIGWNLILEYVIGSASVARGLSLYLDTLLNNTLKETFIDIAPINVSFMSQYVDFLAFGVSIVLAIALAFGLKESTLINKILTLLNISVVIFVIIAGSTKTNRENWHIPKNTSDSTIGEGGFFPFGVEGMIKGAATCFYGFVGFDCIATTGEEVKNPKKAIPFAIILSLFIIFLAYFGTSTVLTLMVPYYSQDKNAPLPHAFYVNNLDWAKWIVAIGAIFALCTSLFGAMFPLPRIIYAMASDSIIFQFLGKVSQRFKTPVVGTLIAGFLTGLMAALFDLGQLINMMSIGTLLAYTIVAASVLLLRYEVEKGYIYRPLLNFDENETYTADTTGLDVGQTSEDLDLLSGGYDPSPGYLKQIFNFRRQELPSETSEKIVKVEVCLYCLLCVFIALCAMYWKNEIVEGKIYAIVLTAIAVGLAVLVVISITTQPKSKKELSFKVPLVPLIPALSILINIYLMLMLDKNTWIRFGVWMTVGIPIYYFSVKTHSDARNESISSIPSGEKRNGYVNHSYVNDESDIIDDFKKKPPAPQPPTDTKIEETIASLDEILESAEADILDRKFSVGTMSNVSDVLREENVQAVVHCSDVPGTPIQEGPPLVQFSGVSILTPESDVANSPEPKSDLSTNLKTKMNYDDKTNDDDDDDNGDDFLGHAFGETHGADDSSVNSGGEVLPDTVNLESEEIPLDPILDQVEEKHSIPPPPPPLITDLIDSNVYIPRPLVRLSAITSAKLKSVEKPETPQVDYSRQNTQVGQDDDNLKFGTQEHKEFLEKLGHTLQQGYVPKRVFVDLKKKPNVNSTPPNVPNKDVSNEDVIEDNIDRDDAKKKLAQFLERTNSLPPFQRYKSENNDRSKWNNVVRNNESNLPDYKEQHRQNMQNIFRSVRLRKEDSFKENRGVTKNRFDMNKTSVKPKDDIDLDRIKHQQNMDGILKSIKLRKRVDSFQNNESQ